MLLRPRFTRFEGWKPGNTCDPAAFGSPVDVVSKSTPGTSPPLPSAQDPNDPEVTDLVILCASTHRLEALARRVGHYGKYSWLLLPVGQGKVLRGNWPAGDSPLMAAK